jgi:hypothetical protein
VEIVEVSLVTGAIADDLMKRYHKEIVAVGYGEKSKSNGKRAVIYESCEPPVEIKKTFGDNLPGWRKVYPEYFRGV